MTRVWQLYDHKPETKNSKLKTFLNNEQYFIRKFVKFVFRKEQ